MAPENTKATQRIMKHHDRLNAVLRNLPSDYAPWGKEERWKDPDKIYPDCSCGCKHFYELKSKGKENIGLDWGVCGNPQSPRAGLLTFEHQGCGMFEASRGSR